MSSVKANVHRLIDRWRIRRFEKRQANRALVDRDAAEHIDRLEQGISDAQRPGFV